MNDDDFVNTSPHETLSDFWANRYAEPQNEKFEPDGSKGDFSQRLFRRADNNMKHNAHSRQHFQLLDHNAAKHKIACRPKRTYPNPRKKKISSKNFDGHKEYPKLNFVATDKKLCGGEISVPQHNLFHESSSVNIRADSVTNCDTFNSDKVSKRKQSKIKSEPEKLGGFLQRFIGLKKHTTKQSTNKDSELQETKNKTTVNNLSDVHKVTKIKSKKKPPPPPPPSLTNQELVTMNVKTIGHDSGKYI